MAIWRSSNRSCQRFWQALHTYVHASCTNRHTGNLESADDDGDMRKNRHRRKEAMEQKGIREEQSASYSQDLLYIALQSITVVTNHSRRRAAVEKFNKKSVSSTCAAGRGWNVQERGVRCIRMKGYQKSEKWWPNNESRFSRETRNKAKGKRHRLESWQRRSAPHDNLRTGELVR